MEDDYKNNFRNLSIAASAAIPIVGGPISFLLDKYVPSFIEEKRDKFLKSLNNELQKIIDSGSKVDLESDRFISIFIRCVKLAIEESEQEKIDSFRNIILNSAIPEKQDFDLTTLLMNWVRDFTVDHIRIIKAIQNNHEISHYEKESDLYYALEHHFRNIPKSFLITLSQDLISKNIVIYGKGKVTVEIPNETGKSWYLSDIGEIFVDYITLPKH
ncbi:MAG: hypothetical protein RI573_14185 [Balneolaceae bacterium]|nr:hypothetical protein [Balneolaceae bacterium]